MQRNTFHSTQTSSFSIKLLQRCRGFTDSPSLIPTKSRWRGLTSHALIPSKMLRQRYFSSVRSPDVLSALKSVAARCFRLPSANERCLQLSGVTLSSPMTFFMAFLRIAVTFEEKGKLGLLIKRQNKRVFQSGAVLWEKCLHLCPDIFQTKIGC